LQQDISRSRREIVEKIATMQKNTFLSTDVEAELRKCSTNDSEILQSVASIHREMQWWRENIMSQWLALGADLKTPAMQQATTQTLTPRVISPPRSSRGRSPSAHSFVALGSNLGLSRSSSLHAPHSMSLSVTPTSSPTKMAPEAQMPLSPGVPPPLLRSLGAIGSLQLPLGVQSSTMPTVRSQRYGWVSSDDGQRTLGRPLSRPRCTTQRSVSASMEKLRYGGIGPS